MDYENAPVLHGKTNMKAILVLFFYFLMNEKALGNFQANENKQLKLKLKGTTK